MTDVNLEGFAPMRVNALAAAIHSISTAHGFTPPSLENLPEKLMLSVSELAEAMEEHRKDRGLHYYAHDAACPDHDEVEDPVDCVNCTPKPEGILVEIADSIIRNLHMMHSLLETVDEDFEMPFTVNDIIIEKVRYNAGRPFMHGEGKTY